MKAARFNPFALGRSNFLRHVLVLMSWTVVAQGISVASMLVLPRLFRPEQFGVYSVVSGLMVMLGIVAAGRYEFSIGLPRLDADAASVFSLCMGLSTLAFIVYLVASIALPIEAISRKLLALDPWWTLVALGAAGVGWYNAATYMALRVGRFGVLGLSKAIVAAVTAGGQILGGLFISRGNGALVVPLLVAQPAGTLFLLWALSGCELWKFDRIALISVAKRYVHFPKYVAPASLLDGLAVLLPVAAITVLYSPVEAGIYALAERSLRAPVTLIGSSVLQVFYQRAAHLRGEPGASRRLLLRTWQHMGALALLPCIALGMFGGSIFTTVFGTEWHDSGRVAETMAFSMFFFFISYPTSNILVVYERTRTFLFWQTMQVVMIGGALWLASKVGSPNLGHTVVCIVVAQIIIYLLSMALQWQAVTDSRDRLTDVAAENPDGNR